MTKFVSQLHILDKNVKICASHAGLTLGEDGATHQILEDIGINENVTRNGSYQSM